MKVTVNETDNTQPGAEASIQAQPKNQIIDSRGRVIKLRDLDPLQESRIILAIGAQAAVNPVYVRVYAIPAAMVESIDGEPYACPDTLGKIEGRIQLLGRDGMDAISAHLYPNIADGEKPAQESEEPDAMRAAAKN